MVTAVITGRELLPEYACNLVFFGVLRVMYYSIDAGSLNLVPRLELISPDGIGHL